MDLSSFGIDIASIIAVGAITEVIKKTDTLNKLKRFYVFIPVIISALLAVGLAIETGNYGSILLNTIKYFGVSSFGYAFIKKTLLQK